MESWGPRLVGIVSLHGGVGLVHAVEANAQGAGSLCYDGPKPESALAFGSHLES